MKQLLSFLMPINTNRITYILKIAILTVVLIMAEFGFYYIVNESQISSFRQKVESSEKAVVTLQHTLMTDSLESVENDLFYLRDTEIMQTLLNTDSYNTDSEVLKLTEISFVNFIQVNPNYAQLRYLNEKGMEIIRVNQQRGERELVDHLELQDKSNRYYFKDAMAMIEDRVYQSVLDLNVEKEEIEVPYKPMVRFVIKVYNKYGKNKGVIVINYDASNMIDSFEKVSANSEGQSYLIDSSGHYLAGHETLNFAFMLDDASGLNTEEPDDWNRLNEKHLHNEISQYYDEHGLHTITEVGLYHNTSHNSDWYIFSLLSSEQSSFVSSDNVFGIIIMEFLKRWYMTVPMLFISWAGVLIFTYRKLHLESITEMAQIDTLTGIFNRNAGLKVAQSNFEYALKNDLDFSVCFIDLNDLKKVNDIHGHEAGDNYIREAVKLITSGFRGSDELIRMGGDEFLLAINASSAVVEKNWQRVAKAIEMFNNENNLPFSISLSHGIASAQEEAITDMNVLISHADQRMYIEKRKIKENRKK